MIGGGLSDEVIQYIEQWIPERKYRSEKKFQNDLQEFLDQQLNESGGTGMGIGLGGGGGSVPVRKEFGQANADVAVGDDIGIELKRDLTNSNVDRLAGQIQKYKKEFSVVVVVACGLSDIGRWRELQSDYGSNGMGVGMNQSEVHFIHKQKENFGKDPSEVNRNNGNDDPFGGMF